MKSLRNFPDPFLAEIAEQPDAMRRAATALLQQRGTLEHIHEAGREARTLVFTGMGSSYDACYPAVNDLAGRGVAALLVDTAELLHFRRPVLNPETLLAIVSQSGESAEIVKLVSEIGKQRTRPIVLSVTNGLGNDLARRANLTLDTSAGHETGPSTMTFAASMPRCRASPACWPATAWTPPPIGPGRPPRPPPEPWNASCPTPRRGPRSSSTCWVTRR